ncbi:MAG: hypothetical protein WBP93_07000 [Pyrinomonadaceae bacterium]
MSAILEKVLSEVKTLSPDDLRRLREEVDRMLEPPRAQMTEDEFEQMLLAKGIISSIPSRPSKEEREAYRSYKPIEVKGKPVSETIIEERR